ncbi:MAG: ATP synthase F1 subunit gamma [Aquificae bacterium]|nr:ATP synthase F1 subunit gamma [Aquificota bacterium]
MAKLNLKDIKRKIQGLKNTKRITNAMKLIAAAKLKSAYEAAELARPYSEKLYEVLGRFAHHIDPSVHPLFEVREEIKSVDIILITADRGLCGAFNSSIIKYAERKIQELQSQGIKVNLHLIGRKGVQYFEKHGKGVNVVLKFDHVFRKTIDFTAVKTVGQSVKERFLKGETDKVLLLHNQLRTKTTYFVQEKVFLPLAEILVEELEGESPEAVYELEVKNIETFVENLLQRYLNFQIYRAMLESNAAEQAARMMAMENATKNAEDAIKKWTHLYNFARQEAITNELIDIVNAVEALKQSG